MEALLSMAVLGASLCALVTAVSSALGAQARLEERALAATLLESKLTEFRVDPRLAVPGETQGRFPEPNDEYNWVCRVEASQADDLFKRVTVELRKGERSGVYRFQTLLAAPPR
jgi:type II secretion system protein I